MLRLGLRAKLLLGFGGLLLIVLAMSLTAQSVLGHYSLAIQRSYREDYDSVAACQSVKESIEQMNLAAQEILWGRVADVEGIQQLEQNVQVQLAAQRAAATLPGESAATDELVLLWNSYREAFPEIMDKAVGLPKRRDLYLTEIYPKSQAARLAAQRLIDMNLAALLAVPAQAQAATRSAYWAMRTLTISGLALVLLFVGLIGRIILRPIGALTNSVREVQRGNLDLSVPVQSRDELGNLAVAFNTMAERLRAYRQSEHERLVRTERATQLTIDNLPDVVLVINPQGKIELANELARQLLGVMPGGNVAACPLPWLSDLSRGTGPPDDYESTVQLDRDGQVRHFLPRSAPIRDDAGRLIGIIAVLADVTGLRRLDEMKNSLLSLVSHELKTPLTSARMILHLLPDQKVGALTPKQLDLLLTARDDVDRLHNIVENLLDMSRIESGKALMDLQCIEPQQLVRESIAPLAGMLEGQRVSLDLDVDAGLGQVWADPTRIGHVFANLITNALRYTPPGGQVTVGAHLHDDCVEFCVKDTGCGIPRQYLHRVFEKFFRVPGQSGGTGSGLGLAITKDIVEAHGGRIRVSSAEGAGCLFAFTLRRGSLPAPQPSTSMNGVAAATDVSAR